MNVEFSADVMPLSDLQIHPERDVCHENVTHRPVLLTGQGRGVAVVQSVADFEEAADERAFMRALVVGLADLDAGREVSLAEAKSRLGLSRADGRDSRHACRISTR